MRFFTCIIGTELLNGRRQDEHFEFVNFQLVKRGWEHWGSFIVKDEPEFLAQTFEFIKSQPDSVMFCFGGIGATPDDYTREIAAKVFTGKPPTIHPISEQIILDRFGEASYPNRIKMAEIPQGASLLTNVINKIPGFCLQNRFFFMPGFPEMAHPMVLEALDKHYPKNQIKYNSCFTAFCSEEALIDVMQELPESIEFSSLPILSDNQKVVELYLASYDDFELKYWDTFFKTEIDNKNISWQEGGYFDA